MANHLQTMNGSDFLDFMKKPDSLTYAVAEYYSIIPKQKEQLSSVLVKDENKSKNESSKQLTRYLHCRVKIGSNEILCHANFLDGYDTKRKYMSVQTPREGDCGKFWKAVWGRKVQIIVMMCRPSNECHQYWPAEKGSVTAYDKFKVKTLDISFNPHYNLTLLSLTDQLGQEHKISHYQYTAWPQDNFSHRPDVFIDFFCNVRDMYHQLERQAAGKKLAPIIVQCLDGVGSSAVFCVFDICVSQFDKTGTLSVPNILKKVRQQKYGIMNRLDYYLLCYQLLQVYVKNRLSI